LRYFRICGIRETRGWVELSEHQRAPRLKIYQHSKSKDRATLQKVRVNILWLISKRLKEVAVEEAETGNVSVKDRGLIVTYNLPFLSASIDGLVKCEKSGEGIVEIK